MKIWEKHLFKELFKLILFFLISIYILYFLIDFSIHGSKLFSKNDLKFFQILTYYYHNFVIYLNLFFPLSLMLSVIKIISQMNINNEITALFMANISKYRLSYPIFIIAFILSLISYLNFEHLTPRSMQSIESFKNIYTRSKKKLLKTTVNTLLLEDGSKLIYKYYDMKRNKLLDVFWINSNDIWHIKYLYPLESKGLFVDHFTYNEKLIKTNSFNVHIFNDMKFTKTAHMSLIPYNARSISSLFHQYKSKNFFSVKDKSHIFAQLNYKLSMPLLPILIALALIPICLKFSRNVNTYLITALSLISFIVFFTLLDGLVILAENQIKYASLILWGPFLACFIYFGYRFKYHV